MDSPYRSTTAIQEWEATTANGKVTLKLGPQHTEISLGAHTWIVSDGYVRHLQKKGRRLKKRSILLGDSKLYVARAWPTGELALWLEQKPGIVERLMGLPPPTGFSEKVVEELRKLEGLVSRMQNALSVLGATAEAFEMGRGQHRIVGVFQPDKLRLYARPIFRERPRMLMEAGKDGQIVQKLRGGRRSIEMPRGVEVVASGDRVVFCHPDGEQVATLLLPWIGLAERNELCRRFRSFWGQPQTVNSSDSSSWLGSPS